MKKTLLGILVILMNAGVSVFAQQMPEPLPLDSAVRMGVLPNGLTYYIRHNNLPEHHAEFFIAQKVGSVLEEESQRGLAHFLEHMAFNGTKNWPGKALLEYLQRHGVKFGANLNAYTSIDETVYNISDVPIDEALHPGIVDSCLLILHDWSGYISLEEAEIDSERGVIHEEWRSRNNAMSRCRDKMLPVLFPNNRYGCRMPIGLMSVVDSFTYDELRNYYHKWYRPDLQGIFVVGDVDVDAVEKKIAAMWEDIPAQEHPAERTQFVIEDCDHPLVSITSDPEMSANIMSINFGYNVIPAAIKLSSTGMMYDLMLNLYCMGINERLSDLSDKPECPFTGAGIHYGKYLVADTKDAMSVTIHFKNGKWKESLAQVMEVFRSAAFYGLTDDEINRGLDRVLSVYEKHYNERDTRKNRQLVAEIQRHFLQHEPMPGVEAEYTFIKELCEGTLKANPGVLNQFMGQFGFANPVRYERNVGIYIMGQQKEDNPLPDSLQLLTTYRDIVALDAKPFEGQKVATSLIDKMPKAGKIKNIAAGPFGTTIWTLSNGARVVWKVTDFKQDEILFSANSFGGTDYIAGITPAEQKFMSSALQIGGLGQLSLSDLSKYLSGKQVDFDVKVGRTYEGLSGSSTVKDLPTLFQLIYLSFTMPRQDYEMWQSNIEATKSQLAKYEGTPQSIISDSLSNFRYLGQPQFRNIHLADLESLDYDKLFKSGKERFANIGDFTFYFIGNVNEDSLRYLCQTYLASLKGKGKKESRLRTYTVTPGTREMRFDVAMEQPKTNVRVNYHLFNRTWSLKQSMVTNLLGQVLSIVFTETIREREGGVYSPHASAGFDAVSGVQSLFYTFDTGEEKRAHIEEVALQEVKRVAEEGISDEMFQKVRDYTAKAHLERVKENSYWLSAIEDIDQEKLNHVDNYIETLQSITPADLQALLKEFLGAGDCQTFVSNGVNK